MDQSSIFMSCTGLDVPDTVYYAADLSEITFSDEPETKED